MLCEAVTDISFSYGDNFIEQVKEVCRKKISINSQKSLQCKSTLFQFKQNEMLNFSFTANKTWKISYIYLFFILFLSILNRFFLLEVYFIVPMYFYLHDICTLLYFHMNFIMHVSYILLSFAKKNQNVF